MGIRKTLARLDDNFICPGIRNDVHKFINGCINYQHTKYEAQKPVGRLVATFYCWATTLSGPYYNSSGS